MNNKKLLVVGELNVDLILNQIQQFPEIGTEIIAKTMNFTLGSSSAIFASNISVMGVDTSFCGMVGADDFGTFILNDLAKKKVNVDYISKTNETKTGITVVMNYDQDRANVTYCGAMKRLAMKNIPWENITDFGHFHLSNYFLQDGIRADIVEIFKKAKAAGLTTSLDLQWDPDNQWNFDYAACLPYVDVFLPNEAELIALTKKDNIADAEEEIVKYTNILALKMGVNGAKVIHNGKTIALKPFINTVFKDAIGAGDSFNAGFIKEFMEEASLSDCLQNANLMGSLNTMNRGGTTSFTSTEAIEQWKSEVLKEQID